MNTHEPLQNLELDTPEGQTLIRKIGSLVTINVGLTGDHKIDLRILLDHDQTIEAISDFLKESIRTCPDFLNSGLINGVNISPLICRKRNGMTDHRLSARKIEILEKIAEGKSDKEIATELKMSFDTVKSHERSINVKLKARNRTHAVVKYLKNIWGIACDPETGISVSYKLNILN